MNPVKTYLSKIGAKGGLVKSPRKTESGRANAAKARAAKLIKQLSKIDGLFKKPAGVAKAKKGAV